MSTPRLQDVARLAGVHTATASRALNDTTRHLVRKETAARVIEAAETLGYIVNPIARGLKTSRSGFIGVVIPDLTNAMFPPIMRGIDSVMEPLGFSTLLVNTDNDKEREAKQLASLRARQVEGLIVGTALLQDENMVKLAAADYPVVLINRSTQSARLPAVIGDNAAGMKLAVKYLIDLGHRQIACLAGPQTTSAGRVRLSAYRDALREGGVPHRDELVIQTQGFTESQGASGARQLLDRGTPFTAIVAGNDLQAVGCFDVFTERGIRCPEDVSITGFNDMPMVDKLRPALTTVRLPQYEIGQYAARMLVQRIQDRSDTSGESVILPVELVPRGSTAAPLSNK